MAYVHYSADLEAALLRWLRWQFPDSSDEQIEADEEYARKMSHKELVQWWRSQWREERRLRAKSSGVWGHHPELDRYEAPWPQP